MQSPLLARALLIAAAVILFCGAAAARTFMAPQVFKTQNAG
jgi:uncharacterized protein involved in exopolysaccharide biosynthesis